MRLLVVRMHMNLRTPRDFMLMILVNSCPILVEWFLLILVSFILVYFLFVEWYSHQKKKKKKINILCFSSFIIFYCWSHYSCFGYLLGHPLYGWWHVGWYTWDMILVILGCIWAFQANPFTNIILETVLSLKLSLFLWLSHILIPTPCGVEPLI